MHLLIRFLNKLLFILLISQRAFCDTSILNEDASIGCSLAGIRLQEIYASQNTFLSSLEEQNVLTHGDPSKKTDLTTEEYCEMKSILLAYEWFILDNPNLIEGYILYGKFLREIGNTEHAIKIFMQADRLNPKIAVVKQQIANYLSENGLYQEALIYLLQAVTLSPETPIYHYQIGELLYYYRDLFIHDATFTPSILDSKMIHAFQTASALNPENRDLAMRHAEAFFDIETKDWEQALKLWEALEANSPSALDLDIIRFQKARVLIELNQHKEARSILNTIHAHALEANRRELLQKIDDIKSPDTKIVNAA